MSDLVLRLARPGEDARIADFINQNFDMRLPLINRADFYQFYYAHTPGAAPQFALAEQDGPEALAVLEKTPLEQLIDHSFSSIFHNMDAKWLRFYERTALFGETLEIVDHSREIDTNLKIICFPTFKGHCGCILFDRTKIQTVREHPGP